MSATQKSIKSLYLAHRHARLHLFTYTPIYLSIYCGYILVPIIFIFTSPLGALLVPLLHSQFMAPPQPLGRDYYMLLRRAQSFPWFRTLLVLAQRSVMIIRVP